MMGFDLGTYFLRVQFRDGSGYIDRWDTGARYCDGTPENSPIGAFRIEPTYDCEDDLVQSMRFQYLENNYSCDCNRSLMLSRAMQDESLDLDQCGHTIKLHRLTMIRPDGSELCIVEPEEAMEVEP